MSIFVIGDLHLSFNDNKPMDIFGENWKNHEEKIKSNWLNKVKENDVVVLPGDFSWATYLENTEKDFEYLNKLPGKKLLLKGNHDYWWTTLTSMRNFLSEKNFKNIDFIYNNAYEYGNVVLTGTRGWGNTEDNDNQKLLKREQIRLELSIKDGIERYGNNKEIIVFMHYPPITNLQIYENQTNEFIEILRKYNVKKCYYAHLHGNSIKEAIIGKYFGVEFNLVSADSLDFKLMKIV